MTKSALTNGLVYDEPVTGGIKCNKKSYVNIIAYVDAQPKIEPSKSVTSKSVTPNRIILSHDYKNDTTPKMMRKSGQFDGSLSKGMGQILSSNPQIPNEVRSKKQKYLESSNMMSLKDLQTKYAAMKTKSTLFEAPPKEEKQMQQSDSHNSIRFNNSFRPKTAMSTLI
jgi:hypothetical protein